jgi:hypothetical protein
MSTFVSIFRVSILIGLCGLLDFPGRVVWDVHRGIAPLTSKSWQ